MISASIRYTLCFWGGVFDESSWNSCGVYLFEKCLLDQEPCQLYCCYNAQGFTVKFPLFFFFFFTLQSSPSPFACEALAEATPPINRPRPVPISSTLNTPLSLLSLQACALHTSAATFYQVPAWCGFSVWFLTDVRFAVVCSYPLIKSCCRLNQQGEKHLMNEQVE